MGLFFNKKKVKEEKIYSLSEALRLISDSKYSEYTTIPVDGGYKIVKQEESNYSMFEEKKNKFRNEIRNNVNVDEQNIKRYGDYTSAKRYNANDWIR